MDVTFEGKSSTGKNEWLTPPCLLRRLGPFDLDPCSPVNRPWDTARHHYTIEDDGLQQPWFGRVFCNPPYDTALIPVYPQVCRTQECRRAHFCPHGHAPVPRTDIPKRRFNTLYQGTAQFLPCYGGTGWYGRSAVMPDRLQQRKYRGSGNMRYRREVGEATTSIVNHKFVT